MGLSECREMCNLNSAQGELKAREQFWAARLPHPYSNWEWCRGGGVRAASLRGGAGQGCCQVTVLEGRL